ncbi:MAG TPA: TolC family protein [Blastocatellia bacterium]|nr:TolC family protein [Blastocatellia bacterium]
MLTMKYRLRILVTIASLICLTAEGRAQSGESRSVEVLTLEQAVAIALRDNPQVKNAAIEVGKPERDYAALKTRRLPNFSFEAVGSQQLTPIDFTFERGVFGTFPETGPIPSEDTKISTPLKPTAVFITRITQPLSQLYETKLNLKLLKLKGEIAQEELRAKQQQIARDVKRAYYALLQTESEIEAAAETIRMYKELDRVTGDYVAQQVALRTESLDVKSRLAKSEYDMMTLADKAGIQKQQINQLLGRDVLTEFTVSAVADAGAFEADLAAARTRALEQRPELREARLKVKQAEGDRRVKKSEFLPDVSASFQHVTTANFNSILPKSYMNVGVTVSWEVFDWGRKKQELAGKDLVILQAQNSVKDAETSVLIEVNDKYNKLRQARQLFAVTQMDREAAAENVRVLTNRYKAQMSLLKDVLQAQSQLEQATNQGRQALLSFWTAKADFETAIGEDK